MRFVHASDAEAHYFTRGCVHTADAQGHLDMIVLAALSAGPAHGYAVIEEIKRRSGQKFNLPEGTVYPALHRLEEAGLLARLAQPIKVTTRPFYRAIVRWRTDPTLSAGAVCRLGCLGCTSFAA